MTDTGPFNPAAARLAIAAWLTPTITAGALLAHLYERNNR